LLPPRIPFRSIKFALVLSRDLGAGKSSSGPLSPIGSIVVEPVIVRKDVVINRFSFVVAHRYTKPISGIGMGAQKYNAEVKVSRADVDLGLVQLSDKLRHVRQVSNNFPVRSQSWPARELLTESLLAARYFFRLAVWPLFISLLRSRNSYFSAHKIYDRGK
jgi:hypothetical protein